jgi:hypothetical protein
MDGGWDYPQSIMMDSNLFMQHNVGLVTKLQWNYFFDYDMLNTEDPERITTVVNAHNILLKKNYPESFSSENEESRRSSIEIKFPLNDILTDFMKTEKAVKTMLVFLQIPILMIFILYIFMTSNLIIQQDRNEIAEGRYSFSDKVIVRSLPNSRGYINLGVADFVHNMDGFSVKGVYNGRLFSMEKSPQSLYSCHIEYEYLGKYGDCVDLNTLTDTWYCYPQGESFSVTKIALATEEMYKYYKEKDLALSSSRVRIS